MRRTSGVKSSLPGRPTAGSRRKKQKAASTSCPGLELDFRGWSVKFEVWSGPRPLLLPSRHRRQELGVVLGFAHLREEQLHRLDGGERGQDLTQHPHAVEVVLRQQELFLARAALL